MGIYVPNRYKVGEAFSKVADLLILNKNPLEDILNNREILYVMKDGVLYDGNTLDILWPITKKCPMWRIIESRILNP